MINRDATGLICILAPSHLWTKQPIVNSRPFFPTTLNLPFQRRVTRAQQMHFHFSCIMFSCSVVKLPQLQLKDLMAGSQRLMSGEYEKGNSDEGGSWGSVRLRLRLNFIYPLRWLLSYRVIFNLNKNNHSDAFSTLNVAMLSGLELQQDGPRPKKNKRYFINPSSYFTCI